MNAEHFHSFCVVAREGNVTAAARLLGLTQPAVSRRLRLLQGQRGTPLYVRRGQGIRLTPAGKELLPYACSVIQALTRDREVLAGEVAPQWRRLRVALSHHLTTRYTGPLLRATRAYNEEGYLLRLHLLEGYTPELVEGLRGGTLDSAFVLGDPSDTEGVRAEAAGTEAVAPVVRDDDLLAAEETLSTGVLAGETLVVPSSASFVYRMFMRALEATGTQPGRTLEVSGPAAVRSAVYAGLAVGVTVSSYVEAEVSDGALRVIELDGPDLVAPVTKLLRDDWFLLPDQQHALAFLVEQLLS